LKVIYPKDDAEVVAEMTDTAKLEYLVVTMAVHGSVLKSAQRKRLVSANKLPCIDRRLTSRMLVKCS
jgi:predicted hotdog family 3-hydroxylacyl-ACP dehydratase